jgi:hypothetical protein
MSQSGIKLISSVKIIIVKEEVKKEEEKDKTPSFDNILIK